MTDALPLEISDDVREAIGTAFASMKFLQASYIGDDGYPHISNRGSVVVLGPQQLGLWARKRDSGMAADVASRPQVTLLYTDLADKHVLYTFYGTATTDADGPLADRVWNEMPERERQSDADRKGTAIVVDLTKIIGMSPHAELNFVMERGA